MSNLIDNLAVIESSLKSDLKKADNFATVEQIRVNYLGRKSEFNNILKSLKELSAEEKISIGKKANVMKSSFEKMIDEKSQALKTKEIEQQISSDWLDVTTPTKKASVGKLHPITKMQTFIEDIFQRMGFEIAYPNEIETDFNNFTAVNIPENHPARDMWDTFWTEDGHVAITHTSSMQHTILKNNEPPIRFIVPGKCFRNEATDARHEHTFSQLEGVYVDRGITMADMIGTFKTFASEFFEKEVDILFTPDFFPFVEPGGMISIDCSDLGERFKKVSKGSKWLEVAGCGMIHPNVLNLAGIDTNVFTGFAWGIGIERFIMLKYGIDDIRQFHSGDLRFINQF